jgi:hypothetical protein
MLATKQQGTLPAMFAAEAAAAAATGHCCCSDQKKNVKLTHL